MAGNCQPLPRNSGFEKRHRKFQARPNPPKKSSRRSIWVPHCPSMVSLFGKAVGPGSVYFWNLSKKMWATYREGKAPFREGKTPNPPRNRPNSLEKKRSILQEVKIFNTHFWGIFAACHVGMSKKCQVQRYNPGKSQTTLASPKRVPRGFSGM